MATASVEFGPVDLNGQGGSSINGRCIYQESLTVSGSAAPMTNALTASQAPGGKLVVRISTDTACFFAIGTSPDPTVQTATAASTAKRHLNAGASIEQTLGIGEKVSVVSAP